MWQVGGESQGCEEVSVNALLNPRLVAEVLLTVFGNVKLRQKRRRGMMARGGRWGGKRGASRSSNSLCTDSPGLRWSAVLDFLDFSRHLWRGN